MSAVVLSIFPGIGVPRRLSGLAADYSIAMLTTLKELMQRFPKLLWSAVSLLVFDFIGLTTAQIYSESWFLVVAVLFAASAFVAMFLVIHSLRLERDELRSRILTHDQRVELHSQLTAWKANLLRALNGTPPINNFLLEVDLLHPQITAATGKTTLTTRLTASLAKFKSTVGPADYSEQLDAAHAYINILSEQVALLEVYEDTTR